MLHFIASFQHLFAAACYKTTRQTKLGAAVSVVQSGIDVIITQCGTKCTEKIVAGNWTSMSDLDSGTLLSPV
jgi:hypothetical protein